MHYIRQAEPPTAHPEGALELDPGTFPGRGRAQVLRKDGTAPPALELSAANENRRACKRGCYEPASLFAPRETTKRLLVGRDRRAGDSPSGRASSSAAAAAMFACGGGATTELRKVAIKRGVPPAAHLELDHGIRAACRRVATFAGRRHQGEENRHRISAAKGRKNKQRGVERSVNKQPPQRRVVRDAAAALRQHRLAVGIALPRATCGALPL
ncbi:hypothetical protein MRX96_006490 [Rhipicephalus microplus]